MNLSCLLSIVFSVLGVSSVSYMVSEAIKARNVGEVLYWYENRRLISHDSDDWKVLADKYVSTKARVDDFEIIDPNEYEKRSKEEQLRSLCRRIIAMSVEEEDLKKHLSDAVEWCTTDSKHLVR